METVNLIKARQFTIEPMTPEDLSSVVALEAECRLSSRGVDGYRKMLSNPNAILLVAVDDHPDRCVVAMFSGIVVVDELQIDNLAVASRYRREGIGSMLLVSALARARHLGARAATLEVRSANQPARAFYEKQRFNVTGIRRLYYAAPPDDALLLSHEIPGES